MEIQKKLKHKIISLKKDEMLIVEIPLDVEIQWKIKDVIQKLVNNYEIENPILLMDSRIKFKKMDFSKLEKMRDDIDRILKERKHG